MALGTVGGQGAVPPPLVIPSQLQPILLEKPKCIPADEDSFPAGTFARRNFPGQRNGGFVHRVAEASGGVAGRLALVSPCHVCRPAHTAARNSVTIWFQLPRDAGASPAPSAITKSEFKHQLNLTRPPLSPFFFNNSGLSLRKEGGR